MQLFDAHFRRVYRYLSRLSGEPELAADIAQETFVKLYQRGQAPDTPEAWLITVGTNLFRNARTTNSRRLRLLTPERGEDLLADASPAPDHVALAGDTRRRVRAALDQIPERDRRMLLLRAEGYSYKEIALALEIAESSIGTLLARAKSAFRDHYEGGPDAS
ncbi:MAG: sigma-70 family RNA polymerase sigma factor [bacterium]